MAKTVTYSGLRDNHTRGNVAEFLLDKIRSGSHLSVVSAYFTIYAYDAMKEVLDSIEHMDFLFGEPTFVNRLDPDRTGKRAGSGSGILGRFGKNHRDPIVPMADNGSGCRRYRFAGE